MPSAPGVADRTPLPAALASCSPDSNSTSRPSARASAISSAPLEASRTAAVATVRSRVTSISRATAAKRASAAIATAIAPGSIAPLAASPRPRPASTFSLNSVAGSRAGPS